MVFHVLSGCAVWCATALSPSRLPATGEPESQSRPSAIATGVGLVLVSPPTSREEVRGRGQRPIHDVPVLELEPPPLGAVKIEPELPELLELLDPLSVALLELLESSEPLLEFELEPDENCQSSPRLPWRTICVSAPTSQRRRQSSPPQRPRAAHAAPPIAPQPKGDARHQWRPPGRRNPTPRRRQREIALWLHDAAEHVAPRVFVGCQRVVLAAIVDRASKHFQPTGGAGARPATEIGPVAAAFERLQQRLAGLRDQHGAAIGQADARRLPHAALTVVARRMDGLAKTSACRWVAGMPWPVAAASSSWRSAVGPQTYHCARVA